MFFGIKSQWYTPVFVLKIYGKYKRENIARRLWGVSEKFF